MIFCETKLEQVTVDNPGTATNVVAHRPFSSLYMKKGPCPYKTLGIPSESTYAAVKKTFFKIAMAHHPDVVGEEDPAVRERSVELFMRSRKAFEAIVEVDDGMSALREEVELEEKLRAKMSDEEFDAWFLHETGHSNPFQFDLDPATMREVAEMTDEIGGGLDRDGGMWQLANMVSQSVKGGKEAASMLRLEAGEVQDVNQDPVDGVLRRRRRRPVRR
eukprot:CAMPEP_0113578118 /NCGR_PEP_ID=MMETSP0015_2-20120614/29285_1 /TAXON_ID=2838 /ORGANISM="Odontella" /LENGTH=217 /DNA_ID=CAMNT_0000481851 /DNA_START=317 /DNA_END=970 /DNA_ORIENTATION=+ /assembly_acc=CAM_ASM_000160